MHPGNHARVLEQKGQTMKLSNGIQLYVKSMGKVFRVLHIAKSDVEANRFMETHRDTGVIAECSNTGLIFIAELHQIKVRSDALP